VTTVRGVTADAVSRMSRTRQVKMNHPSLTPY
jgi:hypothetical protein